MNSTKEQSYLNHEQWKYTKIDYFKDYNFNYTPNTNNSINQKCKKNEILLYNGEFLKAGEIIHDNKIIIYNIKEAISSDIKYLKKHFNKIVPNYSNIYLKNNQNYFSKGYYLYIPNGLELNEPIIINNISDIGDKKSFINYRNFIYCDKNSKVSIINNDSFNISLCTNTVNEVYIHNNSELEIINNSYKSEVKQIYNFAANLNNNSRLLYHALDFGGDLVKNNYYINLNKPSAECLFNGFNISKSNDYIDNYIEIFHNNKNTKSNLNYKIISAGSSKSILFAKAIIKQNSSGCEAYQNNHNLILSEKATIHSNPQLEIYNDDVQCSHGSTTGQIDDEIIHYMRTRGINIIDAKKLILEGFLNDIINKISVGTFTTNLVPNIKKYLQSEKF